MEVKADFSPPYDEGHVSDGTIYPSEHSDDGGDSEVESTHTILRSEPEEEELLDLASSLQNSRRSETAHPERASERAFAHLYEALD
jgi:hypothetical protein